MKICGQAALESGVGIGALVSLKVDYHTHCHVQGLLAIGHVWPSGWVMRKVANGPGFEHSTKGGISSERA